MVTALFRLRASSGACVVISPRAVKCGSHYLEEEQDDRDERGYAGSMFHERRTRLARRLGETDGTRHSAQRPIRVSS